MDLALWPAIGGDREPFAALGRRLWGQTKIGLGRVDLQAHYRLQSVDNVPDNDHH
jgi:hypothetical protein